MMPPELTDALLSVSNPFSSTVSRDPAEAGDEDGGVVCREVEGDTGDDAKAIAQCPHSRLHNTDKQSHGAHITSGS